MSTIVRPDENRIGTVVHARRKALGLSQQDLADLADVSRKFIFSLEDGKPTVRLDKVESVLRVLGLRLEVERAP